MMAEPRPLVAGNWKMNGQHASSAVILDLVGRLNDRPPECDVLVCPPFPLLMPFSIMLEGYGVSLGGQDCHAELEGAHTGDISAHMIKDAGCSYVIVGHSERRAGHGETDWDVQSKATAAHSQRLCAIICVGETGSERDAGNALDVIAGQLRTSIPDDATPQNTVIAYEPVWAIGTGKTPTPDEVGEAHALIRKHLTGRFDSAGQLIRILYGGSVNPGNAAQLMAVRNVDGALVGGASLTAEDFDGIIDTYRDE